MLIRVSNSELTITLGRTQSVVCLTSVAVVLLTRVVKVCLLERLKLHLQDKAEIERYRRKLGFRHAIKNSNGKIWLFVDEIIEVEVMSDDDQQLTCRLMSQGLDKEVWITFVYAKCNQGERLQL
ncbi:uncharacterized protein LOC124898678 [Capsicum annuum]|uniref:uncharacterized protein LOC124898678 n=1 Tax=Capsicum annuum TaxID=4072 RepID=UPI001FB0D589|nr:uncharacterized protein LOC124898678 [Capsicum annuum]